jgi:hypothetical protein
MEVVVDVVSRRSRKKFVVRLKGRRNFGIGDQSCLLCTAAAIPEARTLLRQ